MACYLHGHLIIIVNSWSVFRKIDIDNVKNPNLNFYMFVSCNPLLKLWVHPVKNNHIREKG